MSRPLPPNMAMTGNSGVEDRQDRHRTPTMIGALGRLCCLAQIIFFRVSSQLKRSPLPKWGGVESTTVEEACQQVEAQGVDSLPYCCRLHSRHIIVCGKGERASALSRDIHPHSQVISRSLWDFASRAREGEPIAVFKPLIAVNVPLPVLPVVERPPWVVLLHLSLPLPGPRTGEVPTEPLEGSGRAVKDCVGSKPP